MVTHTHPPPVCDPPTHDPSCEGKGDEIACGVSTGGPNPGQIQCKHRDPPADEKK